MVIRRAMRFHCYWTLRQKGESVSQATWFLEGMSVADKNELLFQNGMNFNDVPKWQKRGIGLYWSNYVKAGVNPVTQENVSAVRRQICTDYDLPMRAAYGEYISNLLACANDWVVS